MVRLNSEISNQHYLKDLHVERFTSRAHIIDEV